MYRAKLGGLGLASPEGFPAACESPEAGRCDCLGEEAALAPDIGSPAWDRGLNTAFVPSQAERGRGCF